MQGRWALVVWVGLVSAGDEEMSRVADRVRSSLPSLRFAPAPSWEPQRTAALARNASAAPAHRGMAFLYTHVNWLIAKLQPNPFPQSNYSQL